MTFEYKKKPVPHFRNDTFKNKKALSVSIEKTAFIAVKRLLFDYEISITALISFFLSMLAENDKSAVTILEKLLQEKANKKFSLIQVPKMEKVTYQEKKLAGLSSIEKKNIYNFFENEDRIYEGNNEKLLECDISEIKDDDE